MQAFEELANRAAGHLILINMEQALSEDMLSKALLSEFIKNLNAKIGSWTTSTDAEFFFEVRHAVWDDSRKFQLQGPSCTSSDSQVVILKSYSDLSPLVKEVRDSYLRAHLLTLVAKPYDVVSDAECEELAECLNDVDPNESELHLGRRINGRIRLLVWSTRLQELSGIGVASRPDNSVASRIRDQLGLGHFRLRYPMFAFVSQSSYMELIAKAGHLPKRPIIFDAIDQIWFKHKRDRAYVADNWGRSTDLEKVLLSSGADLDGGPEAVSESFQIAGNFRCVFLGRTMANPPEPDAGFIRRLTRENDMAVLARNLELQIGRP